MGQTEASLCIFWVAKGLRTILAGMRIKIMPLYQDLMRLYGMCMHLLEAHLEEEEYPVIPLKRAMQAAWDVVHGMGKVRSQ